MSVSSDLLEHKEYYKVTKSWPKGFVGWARDVNENLNMKLCVANISEKMIHDMDLSFMTKYQLEYINYIHAKNPEESLRTVFFSKKTSFRDCFLQDAFVPQLTGTGLTLGESMNFVPKSEIDNYFKEEARRKAHTEHHHHLLKSNFAFAYKSFQSGTMGRQEPGYGNEQRDVDTLIKMCLAFGPGTVCTLLEVGVGTTQHPNDCLPHGYMLI